MRLDNWKYRLSVPFDRIRRNAVSTTCAASAETAVAVRSETDEAIKGTLVAFSRDRPAAMAPCQLNFLRVNDFPRLCQKTAPPNASAKISVPILGKRFLFPTRYTKGHPLGVVAGDAKPQPNRPTEYTATVFDNRGSFEINDSVVAIQILTVAVLHQPTTCTRSRNRTHTGYVFSRHGICELLGRGSAHRAQLPVLSDRCQMSQTLAKS
jgi:hypothetical protein